ncbi:MAG TPA: hypothetical protein VF278_15515 [Pirellulales bacterium]
MAYELSPQTEQYLASIVAGGLYPSAHRAARNDAATSVADSWSAVIHHRFPLRLQPPFAASRLALPWEPPLPLSVLVEKQRSLRDEGKRR